MQGELSLTAGNDLFMSHFTNNVVAHLTLCKPAENAHAYKFLQGASIVLPIAVLSCAVICHVGHLRTASILVHRKKTPWSNASNTRPTAKHIYAIMRRILSRTGQLSRILGLKRFFSSCLWYLLRSLSTMLRKFDFSYIDASSVSCL